MEKRSFNFYPDMAAHLRNNYGSIIIRPDNESDALVSRYDGIKLVMKSSDPICLRVRVCCDWEGGNLFMNIGPEWREYTIRFDEVVCDNLKNDLSTKNIFCVLSIGFFTRSDLKMMGSRQPDGFERLGSVQFANVYMFAGADQPNYEGSPIISLPSDGSSDAFASSESPKIGPIYNLGNVGAYEKSSDVWRNWSIDENHVISCSLTDENGIRAVNVSYDLCQNSIAYGNFMVDGVGDCFCGLCYTFECWCQDFYTVLLVLSGHGCVTINHTKYDITSGDLALIVPGDYYFIASDDGDPMRYLYFNFTMVHGTMKRICNDFNASSIRLLHDCGELSIVFFSIFGELQKPSEYQSDMLSCYMTQLVVRAYRALAGESERNYTPPNYSSSAREILYDIIRQLDSPMLQLENLADIKKNIGYSRAYISQVFSKEMGMPLSEYFHIRLFERAVSLLKNGVRVTDIAEQLGYRSVQAFSRAFLRFYGVSPSRYLEQHNKDARKEEK